MKTNNELPFIDKSEILSAELRRLNQIRNLIKKETSNSKPLKFTNQEKNEIYEKTNGKCHFCGNKLSRTKFSITSSIKEKDELSINLPACLNCKRIFDNYLPDEIRWIQKIGLWAKTQIEFETEIGKAISSEIIEQEKHRENKRKNPRKPQSIDISKYPVKYNQIIGSKKNEYKTIKEVLFWSYANLGMANKAVYDKSERYGRLHYIIRKKLFNGLMSGNMNIRSMFHDEKAKLNSDKCCVYCGKQNTSRLTI